MMIKNILDSLHDKIVAGSITYRTAAEELCKAGWFPYVPSEEQVKNTLKLYN